MFEHSFCAKKRKWDSQPKVALSQLSNRTSLVKPLSCSLSCSTSSPSLLPSPKALGLLAPRGYATGVPLFLRHEKRTPFVRGFSPLEFCETMSANRLSGIHCPWQCAAPRLPLQVANPQNSFFVLGNPNRRIALGLRPHPICIATQYKGG